MSTEVNPQIASDFLLQCDIVNRGDDIVNSTSAGYPLATKFPSQQDIKTAYMLLQGYTQQFFPLIPYKKLLTEEREIDGIHGEIMETQKRWSSLIQLRTFCVPSVITQPQTGFGIEDVRTVELLIAVPDLVFSGLAVQDQQTFDVNLIGRLGDHFFYHNREYEVLTFVPAAFFGNTDIPLYYQVKSELWRPNSPDDFGIH
jgi:hypothetical protein